MTLQQTIALDPGQAFERTRSAAIDAKLPFVRYDDVRHVPGKKGLPVLGTLPEAAWDPLAFAQRMYAAYGPVHRFYACGNWNVQLIGPTGTASLQPMAAGSLCLIRFFQVRCCSRTVRSIASPAGSLAKRFAKASSIATIRSWPKK
jgi:hypothetical protein